LVKIYKNDHTLLIYLICSCYFMSPLYTFIQKKNFLVNFYISFKIKKKNRKIYEKQVKMKQKQKSIYSLSQITQKLKISK